MSVIGEREGGTFSRSGYWREREGLLALGEPFPLHIGLFLWKKSHIYSPCHYYADFGRFLSILFREAGNH